MELDLTKIMMALMRMVPIIIFIVLVAIAMSSFDVVVKEKDIDRVSIEAAEGLMSSPLSTSRAVFLESELDDFSKKYGSENGANIEPYSRLCDFGYYLKISDLERKNEWEFGYRPSEITKLGEPSIIAYPVGIFIPGPREGEFYNTVSPAFMILEIHDSWLTRATCLAEKAIETRDVEKIGIGCVKVPFLKAGSNELTRCGFSIVRTSGDGDHLCIFDRNYDSNPGLDSLIECRYVPGIDVRKFSKGYNDAAVLRAVPVAPGTLVNCENTETLDGLTARTGPAEIVFCLEEL